MKKPNAADLKKQSLKRIEKELANGSSSSTFLHLIKHVTEERRKLELDSNYNF